MNIIDEIKQLKKERQAIILAHNYTNGEIQDIADFTGDSLELSIKAAQTDAPVILFCGVSFMAETAKVLSPKATVLLPVAHAGCPMADMSSAEQVAEYRKNNPDAILVAYINTTAATKAYVDICCTSANAQKVLESLPADKPIMFLPDRNLGSNTAAKLNREITNWPGCCPVHDAVTPEQLKQARQTWPNAFVMIHPECRPEVIALADAALSTGAMARFAAEHPEITEYIVCTEARILHRLVKENPGCTFHTIMPELTCEEMQKITLESVRDCLKNMAPEIKLSDDIIEAARKPIQRMLDLK